MTDEGYESKWRAIGQSIRGASHARAGLPDQDAIRWLPESGSGPPLILAVSDGHGSARCFRSDVGARLAVQTATKVIAKFLESLSESPNGCRHSRQPEVARALSTGWRVSALSTVKRWAEENLPREIVRSWRAAVADDVFDRPFTSAELRQLNVKVGVSKRRQVVLDPALAYGATLLTVLVEESFILYLQLGDGDILTVSEVGKVSRPRLPADERLFADETTSLCASDAWRDFRDRFQVISGSPPALIMASTDGYANSFRDEAGFLSVGADILEMLRSDGLDKVSEDMETWLTEASQKGSGDDITLGVLCRMDALELPAGGVPATQPPSVGEEETATGMAEDAARPPSELRTEKPQDIAPEEESV